MDFSVVIPVYNRPEAVARCVRAILAGDFPRERYEVIVVDSGSTDDTPRASAEAGARVVVEGALNRCHSRNRGAAEAKAPWVAFIDSDCIPDSGWLAKLAAFVERLGPEERVAAVAGAVGPTPAQTTVEEYIDRRRWLDQEKFLSPGRRYSLPFAAMANLMVRRDVYLELGGLDAGLAVAGEDADWCWRAAEAGWSIRYAPEAAVEHDHRATLGGLWRQAYHYGTGNAELFAKWRGKWGARVWIDPNHYVWALKALIKTPWALATGRTPLDRREAFYDLLANTAQALGRARGGMKRGTLVL